MRSASWWTEWPEGPIRTGVLFLVTTVVVAVAIVYPQVLRELGRDASANSALSYADREIAGGNGIVVDQAAVYAARALIPADARYHVAVGDGYVGSTLTRDHVAGYFRYFLMPRRPAEAASWVVCYGCDRSEYGDRAEVVWTDGDDLSIVKVGQ
jgi:hypothetical protein